jgi:hypothetical protein
MYPQAKDTLWFATVLAATIAWSGVTAALSGPPAASAHSRAGAVAVVVQDGAKRALCAATHADPATLVDFGNRTC